MPVLLHRPVVCRKVWRPRELSTLVSEKNHKHHHHHRDHKTRHAHQNGFMMTCSCGIGSSPADHDQLHDEPKPKSEFFNALHATTERIHSSVPVGVISVSAAVIASLFPVASFPLVAGVFTFIGLPAVFHLISKLTSSSHPIKALLDVHSLMTLSAFAALAIGQGPEGAFLLALFQLAHAIQHRIVLRAKKDVNRLADLVPDTVQVISGDGHLDTIDSGLVSVGSHVLVRPNAVIPIDGRLVKPAAISVLLAHLTGEAEAVEKICGDIIPAGAVNFSQIAIQIETTNTAVQSTLQRIVGLAEAAAKSRPKVGSWISETAPKYSSVVLAGTASIALCGPLFFQWTMAASVYKALSFLVAASPCALLVASPVAQAAAVSACSRRGIVLSGGAKALERFATAGTVCVDKTGTITEGRMHVVDIESVKGDKNVCVKLGAVLGRFGSTHPVSQGIGRHITGTDLKLVPLSVIETPGISVSGSVFDKSENREWQVVISKYASSEGGVSKSRISVHSADSEEHECIVSLEDRVRSGVVESIKNSKIPIFMLTGDNSASALRVADEIGLEKERVFSQLSPEMKAHIVTAKFQNAVMVGDGVNDAPALAAAKAGGVAVAPSASSESIQSAAVSVADAVVVADERSNPVEAVSFLIEKSKQTSSVIKSNVGIALLGMMGTVAAVMFGNVPLWLAVLVHEGSTELVVLNSLRNL